jgi:hypothetical protein
MSAISRLCITAIGLGTLYGAASGQGMVIMADSTNDRLVSFNPFDGSVINPNMFALQGGTSLHAMPVGNEIWVSEQVGDRVSRWDYAGNLLGNIGGQFTGGGLDNIRGMALVGNTVYVTNSGTANGAPGPAIVMFDLAGNNLGFFATGSTAPSPFGILHFQGGLLVSSSSANDDVHRFSLGGASLGTFHNSTSVNFAQQMVQLTNGNILIAGFSTTSGLYELNAATGNVVNFIAAGSPRGVYQLGNGNILWTNAGGAHVYDVTTLASTQIYAGGGRYLTYTPVPEPASMAVLGIGLAAVARRRRRSRG